MISVVLYGRNDNYGYNLHKRAAVSLNCIAEVLDGRDDEILFVDYNTPDDMPTFIEAILDTLTDRARELIRVLRARPALHRRFADRSRLNALEPVARNIAVRRSNPNNKWILSTNTDMVFVLRDGHRSLTDAVADLKPAYYGVPRFEMPETLWESLDRRDPKSVIRQFQGWGRSLHLDEVVHSHKSILFDAPGDFQLVPRDDLFKIHAFHEGMLLGWHVDSNLAKRFLLLHGATHSLFQRVASYHCDHTKVATPAHGHDRQENDLVAHVSDVKAPPIPEQAESWGAPDVAVEELRFPPGRQIGFAAALAPILGAMPAPVYEALYTEKSFNRIAYAARHVLPYLADQLATFPRDIDLAYAGLNDTMRALLAQLWRALGFTGRMLVLDQTAGVKPGCTPLPAADAPGYVVADIDYLAEQAGLFVFDFGVEDGPDWPIPILHPKANPKSAPLLPMVKTLQCAALRVAAAERRRMADKLPPRRLVLVNTINGQFAGMLDLIVAQTVTPYCTRVRHGFVKPDPADILAQRRADADRLAESMGRTLVEGAFKSLPVDLLDQRDPHSLLTDAQRAEVTAAIGRFGDDGWKGLAKVALGTLVDADPARLEAFLACGGARPEAFIQHLGMLRQAAAEAMSRPWPAARAAALARACGAFLDGAGAVPEALRTQAIAAMIGLCRGAIGGSLGALAERLADHAAGLAAAPQCAESDAWTMLAVAPLAAGLATTPAALRAAALRRIAGDARPKPKPGAPPRIVALACAPYASARDPAGAELVALLRQWAQGPAPRPALTIHPLAIPDAAFLALARSLGARLGDPVPGDVVAPLGLKQTAAALAQAVRAVAPAAVLLVGDNAAAQAALALGLAPLQATIAAAAADPPLPGVDAQFATAAAAGECLAQLGRAPAKGGSVGVAAR